MAKKKSQGYWDKGVWVRLDELPPDDSPPSKTELKALSVELQNLGEELLTLRKGLYDKLRENGHIGERLHDELKSLSKITNFEGRRRQSQFVGKLMRTLGEEDTTAIREALNVQRLGSARETMALHVAEKWRDDVIASDDALNRFIDEFGRASSEADPGLAGNELDAQQLRALVRQARKEAAAPANGLTANQATSQGAAPRQSKAYREVFQLIKGTLA